MKRIISTIAALAVGICSLWAQQDQMMQLLPNDPAVKVGKLENGLTYYIRHNEKPAGRAEFYLATDVGAIQEEPDQDGLAHFLEHMCFNGTKNFPDKGIINWLQSIGASFGGNVNASTGVEQTVYMLTNIPLVRQSVIDTCILIMHDYSCNVLNETEEIDKERPVIIEERRARRNASWRMHEKSLPLYYGDSKYGSCTLIGLQESLENFKPESLRNFYHTWYHPDMQALVVVGDVDVDYTEQKIAEIFGQIPYTQTKPKDVIKIPDNAEPIVGIITDPEASSTGIEVLWKSDPMPEEFNATVMGSINDAAKSIISIVMRERFEDISAKADAPFLGASIGIGNFCESLDAVMGNIAAKEGEAIPAFEAFMTEIEKLRRFGVSEAEVERAKTNMLAGYESAAKKADTRKNNELVQPLLNNFFDKRAYMEPNTRYELMKQLLPMLNTQNLNAMAAQAITDSNLVIIYKAPEKEGLAHPTENDFIQALQKVKASDIQANEDDGIGTELLDATALKGCKIKKETEGLYGSKVLYLKNGMKVILYPTDLEKNKIVFNLSKNGGMSVIPTEDLPSFEHNIYGQFLSNSGLSEFPATTLVKMLAGKNVGVSPFISSLRHGVSGSSAPKDIETAFQLAYLYFADPRFDETEYQQGIKTIDAVLPNLVSQPNYKFQTQASKTLYGDHPRNQIIDETTTSKASLATIEKNYRKLYADAAGASLIVVGDFNIDEIKPLIVKYFGSIPKGKKALKWKDSNIDVLPGERINDFEVDMQTPKTTVVEVYTAPMKYNLTNSVALSAASYILDMRYVKSLREEEGGTYGAGTNASISIEPKQVGTIEVSFNSKPSSADKLRELAVEGLKTLGEEGPTEEEFDMAKKNQQKTIPERRITNNYWLSCLRSYENYGIDVDKEREAAVEALTAEDIKRVVAEILASGNFVEIIMRPGQTAETE